MQYEQLASEYLIKATPKLDEYSLVAHNLYNRALFDLRQGFFKKKYIKGYSQLDQIFKERYQKRELMLYHSLGLCPIGTTDFKRGHNCLAIIL